MLVAGTAILTALGMYAAWQADRAALALRLSQMQVRATNAEGELKELKNREERVAAEKKVQEEAGLRAADVSGFKWLEEGLDKLPP